MKTTLDIKGIHCKGCVNIIQAELMLDPAIDSVDIDLKAGKALISHSPDKTADEIIAKINSLNYTATLSSDK